MDKKKKIAITAAVSAGVGVASYRLRKSLKHSKDSESITDLDSNNTESKSISQVFSHTECYYEKHIKRTMDIICSGLAVVVLSPVFLVSAVAVWISLGRPVIFVQERLGKDEVPFNLLKFRSMKNVFDEYGVPLPDQKRRTRIGNIIRKLSIDELPSLINILKGDMSIVGPRPLPTNYGPWFYENERKRHSVKGGLTGLAQINGRNVLSWEERFVYDLQYVDHITFLGDVKIILKTVEKVLKRSNIGERGVNSPGDFHVYRSGMTEQELVMWEKEKREKECNA